MAYYAKRVGSNPPTTQGATLIAKPGYSIYIKAPRSGSTYSKAKKKTDSGAATSYTGASNGHNLNLEDELGLTDSYDRATDTVYIIDAATDKKIRKAVQALIKAK